MKHKDSRIILIHIVPETILIADKLFINNQKIEYFQQDCITFDALHIYQILF